MKTLFMVLVLAAMVARGEQDTLSTVVLDDSLWRYTTAMTNSVITVTNDHRLLYLQYRIETTVSTNIYHPKQYKQIHYYPTYPMTTEEEWVDSPWGNITGQDIRDNPDIRITEVRERRVLKFQFEGKDYEVEISNKVLSETKEIRKTSETWEVEK